MIVNKKVIESTVLSGVLVIAATVTATTTHVISGTEIEENVTTAESRAVNVVTNGSGTAGVIGVLGETAVSTMAAAGVSLEQAQTDLVAMGEEEAPAEEQTLSEGQPSEEAAEVPADEAVAQTVEGEISPEAQEWSDKLMADVDQYLNVRSAADETAEVVGKLYVGDAADIVEAGDTWTHITSGSVDGYVMNSYCVTGADAYEYAQETVETTATAMTGGLRLRSEPSEDAAILDAVGEGTTLTVNTDTDAGTEWIAVTYNGIPCYVSSQYVDVSLDIGTAVTIEEEQARIAAEEAEKAQQAAEAQKTQNAAVAATADDVTLLGALIQCEAGSESYEGQLAVGAVVMNRLRSGRYGSSVYSVIYAGGQFTPAGSGSVARVAAGGVKASCLQAAQDALNGTDNTGGATCFRSVSSGHAGVVIGNHVFW